MSWAQTDVGGRTGPWPEGGRSGRLPLEGTSPLALGVAVATAPRDTRSRPSLEIRDYERILRLLEDCSGARSPGSFREVALDGLARHFGYRNTTFFVGDTLPLVFSDSTPVTTGRATRLVPAAYLDRFHRLDPFAIRARGHSGLTPDPLSLDAIANQHRPDHREYLDRFLFRNGIHAKVLIPLRHSAGAAGIGLLAEDANAFTALDLARATTLAPHLSNLYTLQIRPAEPPAVAADLTPRQAEVAAMAANGATNAQIAAALFITVDTVKKHLSAVYATAGCTSRAQLTALWHTRRPV